MIAKPSTNWIYQGVFYVAAGLIYAAIALRSYLLYQGTPELKQVLALLLFYLVFAGIELILRRRVGRWFYIYLVFQTIVVCLLIYGPNFKEYDYFSLLFAILGMQAMQNVSYRGGIFWILLFILLIGYSFVRFEGPLEGSIRVLLFGSVIIFLSAYALASRRAQEARLLNQSLVEQLQQANLQLEVYSDTLEKLGIANERQRMARELHDSVTQTIFSMTLTTQSALLLLERDPSRLAAQLERLNQLSRSALEEMHTLISELRPNQAVGEGLVTTLRQHLASRQLPEGLALSIETEGEFELSPAEEQGLFRITQEALNNVIKHAYASHVKLRLHLAEPYWIEIQDDGQGFDYRQAQGGGRMGLTSMRERAAEIGWDTQIQSSPGEGTRIRVEKKDTNKERP
jgi:signal transduction histidine kinase